jgi:hypothetical protein
MSSFSTTTLDVDAHASTDAFLGGNPGITPGQAFDFSRTSQGIDDTANSTSKPSPVF